MADVATPETDREIRDQAKGHSVRELAELLGETGLSEIEVADGDRRIRVAKSAPPVAMPMPRGDAPPEMTATLPSRRRDSDMMRIS